MLKTIQLTFLCLLMASCHQNSSYVSRYGQSIVLNPNQTQSTSDTKLKNLITSKSLRNPSSTGIVVRFSLIKTL